MLRAVVVAVMGAASLQAAQPARLSLSHTAPGSVRGSGFHAAERVRVTARSPGGPVAARRVSATRAGTFLVHVPGLSPRTCAAVTISAVGSRGSRAVLRLRPQPECAPR